MGRRRVLAAAVAAVGAVVLLAELTLWRRDEGTQAAPVPASPSAAVQDEPAALASPLGAAAPTQAPEPLAAGSERREVTAHTPWTAPLRGRVVYLGHEEVGVPGLRIGIDGPDADTHVTTDREGRFEAPHPLPRRALQLSVDDPLTSSTYRGLRHEHRPGLDGIDAVELAWPLEVGPTFLVRLVDAPHDADGWRLRLLERPVDGGELPWGWIETRPGDGPDERWARYRSVVREPRPESQLLVQVTDAEGLHGGEAPIAPLGSVHELTVPVGVVGAILTGRVTDEEGRPVRARLHALRDHVLGQEAFSWPSSETDPDGRYLLGGLEPGATRLVVASPDRALTSVRVDLHAGQRQVQDVRLATVRIAGDIRGALVAPTGGPDPVGLLRLRCLDGEVVERIQVCSDDEERDGPGAGLFAAFTFRDLPQGRYLLELTPFDGRRYEPATLELSPPAEDVLLVTREVPVDDGEQELVLTVRDEDSGDPIDRFAYLHLFQDLWVLDSDRGRGEGEELELPRGLSLSMLILAPGRVPRMACTDDARRVGERLELEVGLVRGERLAVLALDGTDLLRSEGIEAGFLAVPAARGLPGVRVRARGQLLATTDAHGLALCPSRPALADLEVSSPGWSLAAIEVVEPLAQGMGYVQAFLVRD